MNTVRVERKVNAEGVKVYDVIVNGSLYASFCYEQVAYDVDKRCRTDPGARRITFYDPTVLG